MNGPFQATRMWTSKRSEAIQEFIRRKERRKFTDGPIAGLLIDEFWHSDVPPIDSEQRITFFMAELSNFESIEEFTSLVVLFDSEDGLNEAERLRFKLIANLVMIEPSSFQSQWQACVNKLTTPPQVELGELSKAYVVAEDWNDKFYVASDSSQFYAVLWSTSA